MRRRVVPIAVVVSLLVAATSAPAQIMSGMRNQPGPRDLPPLPLDTNVSSDTRPTFRMKVTRVEVSALVVDGKGEPVRDLKASEVELYDGGRKQDIQSFTAYTYHGGAIPLDTVDSPTDPNASMALITNAWSSSSRVIALLIDDLHIDARSKVELHQRVDRLRGRLHDVEQPLVRPHLELLARLLVDVRRTVDGKLLDSRRQGNGTADESTRAARRVGDVARCLIKHSMIERLQANPDVLRFHVPTDAKEPANRSRGRGPLIPTN